MIVTTSSSEIRGASLRAAPLSARALHATRKGALPTSVTLGPSELAIFSIQVSAKTRHTPWATKTEDERTFYPNRFLENLAAARDAAAPYTFGLDAVPVALRVRISLGGNFSALAAALTATAFHVEVNGVACIIDPQQQMSSKMHVQPKDNSFFASLDVTVEQMAIPVPTADDASQTVNVLVWSDAAGSLVVSTVVVVARFPASNRATK